MLILNYLILFLSFVLALLVPIAIIIFLIVKKKFLKCNWANIFSGALGYIFTFVFTVVLMSILNLKESTQVTNDKTGSINIILFVVLLASMVATEIIRFAVFKGKSSKITDVITFTTGFSLMDAFIAVFPFVNQINKLSTLYLSLISAVIVVLYNSILQILLSYSAYNCIKDKKYVNFFAIMLVYYLSLAFAILINNIYLLNVLRIVILLASAMICYAFLPKNFLKGLKK